MLLAGHDEVVFIAQGVEHCLLAAPVEDAEFCQQLGFRGRFCLEGGGRNRFDGRNGRDGRNRCQSQKIIGADLEKAGQRTNFAVAGGARAFFDAVEHALMDMDGLCQLALLNVALDSQVVDSLADIAFVWIHTITSLHCSDR